MFTPGTTVRFKRGPLGLTTDPHQRGFEPETAKRGDTGTYSGLHPDPQLAGWAVVDVAAGGGRTLICPVPTAWIEAV